MVMNQFTLPRFTREINSSTRILMVGAGALGGYFGGRLLEINRDVTFLLRPHRVAELNKTGSSSRVLAAMCVFRRRPTFWQNTSRLRFMWSWWAARPTIWFQPWNHLRLPWGQNCNF